MRYLSMLLALMMGIATAASVAGEADQPAAGKKKIVLVAGKPSHPYGSHEHNAGCTLLAKLLNESGLPVEAVVFKNGWPSDPHVFDGAAAVIMFCDGGNGHMVIPHLKEVDELNAKGVSIGCLHYGVEVPKDKGGPEFLKWIGGYFETFWSVNPHWTAQFTKLPNHPVANGVKPFATNDEWYFHMRFRENMDGVTPILTAVPPDTVRKGKDDAHGGNPVVRAEIGKGTAEHVMWVSENKNGTRGFGCTGSHFHWNWTQDDYRKTILNAIVWIAKIDVPANGVESKRPVFGELLVDLDKPQPKNFDKAKTEELLNGLNPAK